MNNGSKPDQRPAASIFKVLMSLLHYKGASKWDPSQFKFLVSAAAAASSSPLGGSGAEYTEQLHGSRPKQKPKQIAGIDQEEVDDPTLLADSDSCFCEFNGVHIHHKIFDAELSAPDTLVEKSTPQSLDSTKRVNFPMILLHGFGASLFSWNRVMKPLAQVAGSKVLAFDRPAFGLTSRVNAIKHSSSGNHDSRPLNPYSTMFSALATLHFVEFLAAQKAILVGYIIVRHSAGALIAVDAYFEAPERVAALILVAPAIIAPLAMRNIVRDNKDGIKNQVQGNSPDSNTFGNLFFRFCSILSKLTKIIAEVIVRMVKGMAVMISSVYKNALSAILRSAFGVMVVRMISSKFGIQAVRAAWYDSNQVSDHVVQGYTKPMKVKGWDKALVEYTVAMLTDSASEPKKLSEISCPVLIVTGDTDRLVPSWNSEKLSRAIPGSAFEMIKNCGHLPQEEKPEEFVSIVDKFLQRVFAVTEEEQHMQAVIT
ncbi:uncharacterized hydrolase yugf [Phtheirospermum japonicum]|uniref:Uncharacterized hydrolase yugf n=1 Tax=Phtheirospermum japonicum TaxID=374723 RepID=A0A830BTQ0_9LAMI|nr:uncharacterized hydrolase yugf [Phtheirospermum japonicum]